jgi:hypothetical protein
LVGGENVAEIGPVQDIFEGGEHFDPYRRPIFTGNESGYHVSDNGATVRMRLTLLSRTRQGRPQWA